MNFFLKKLPKILFVNFLILFFFIVLIELFFGYWFDKDNFGPYMREHRMKNQPTIISFEKPSSCKISKTKFQQFIFFDGGAWKNLLKNIENVLFFLKDIFAGPLFSKTHLSMISFAFEISSF